MSVLARIHIAVVLRYWQLGLLRVPQLGTPVRLRHLWFLHPTGLTSLDLTALIARRQGFLVGEQHGLTQAQSEIEATRKDVEDRIVAAYAQGLYDGQISAGKVGRQDA